jgi:peptide/nickel transport system substrate-binding protein
MLSDGALHDRLLHGGEHELLGIGAVAAMAGLPSTTLRYYESEGLVPPPARVSGRRRYHPRVLRRLALITAAKEAGFCLAEVRELLDGIDGDGGESPTAERWRRLAEHRLPEVEELIARASTMKRLLEQGPACESLRLDDGTRFAGAGRQASEPSPFGAVRGPGLVHTDLLFDTLLWKDGSGTIMGWLASEWSSSADGREWRFVLRPGVRWHDGRPLTAEDVVFTFDYLTRGPGRAHRGVRGCALDVVADVVLDRSGAVVVRLDRPYAAFEEWVAGRVLILPAHLWSGVTDPAERTGVGAITGSGPYRLKAFDPATGAATFVANDAYFFGPPFVRCLEFASSADPLAALCRGDIDATNGAGEDGVGGPGPGAGGDGGFSSISAPGEWTRALHFNLTRGAPFDDVRFRRAVAFALDRPGLVRSVLDGRGEVGSMGGLAPSHPLTPSDLPCYDRDLDRAKSLFDDVGLAVPAGGRGWRRQAGGGRFRPELLVCSRCPTATIEGVGSNLAAVGIELDVVRLDPPDADARAAAGHYDLALIGYGGLGGDPDGLRLRLSSTVAAGGRAQVRGYANPVFEDRAERQSVTRDVATRRRLVAEMQRVVAADVPMIPLYVPTRSLWFDRQVFDAWYFTPGGVWGGYPGPFNKHALLTGRLTGF